MDTSLGFGSSASRFQTGKSKGTPAPGAYDIKGTIRKNIGHKFAGKPKPAKHPETPGPGSYFKDNKGTIRADIGYTFGPEDRYLNVRQHTQETGELTASSIGSTPEIPTSNEGEGQTSDTQSTITRTPPEERDIAEQQIRQSVVVTPVPVEQERGGVNISSLPKPTMSRVESLGVGLTRDIPFPQGAEKEEEASQFGIIKRGSLTEGTVYIVGQTHNETQTIRILNEILGSLRGAVAEITSDERTMGVLVGSIKALTDITDLKRLSNLKEKIEGIEFPALSSAEDVEENLILKKIKNLHGFMRLSCRVIGDQSGWELHDVSVFIRSIPIILRQRNEGVALVGNLLDCAIRQIQVFDTVNSYVDKLKWQGGGGHEKTGFCDFFLKYEEGHKIDEEAVTMNCYELLLFGAFKEGLLLGGNIRGMMTIQAGVLVSLQSVDIEKYMGNFFRGLMVGKMHHAGDEGFRPLPGDILLFKGDPNVHTAIAVGNSGGAH